MTTTEEYLLLRDENRRLHDQLKLALDASTLGTHTGAALADGRAPLDALIGNARYVVALYDALLALRDATVRGTAAMAEDKVAARKAVMAVADSVLSARLLEELQLVIKFASAMGGVANDAPSS